MIDFGSSRDLVVVLSGGLDSACLLYAALDAGKRISLFHGYFSKPSSQHELAFAKWVSSKHSLPLEVVDLSGITRMQVGYVDPVRIAADEADVKAEELTDSDSVSGFHTLISVGMYFTQITGKDALAVGVIGEQLKNRPALPEAFELFGEVVLRINPGAKLTPVLAPMMGMSKGDVLQHGAKLGVPFGRTWSCSSATVSLKHCGVCSQCLERKLAFKDTGIADPTEYLA